MLCWDNCFAKHLLNIDIEKSGFEDLPEACEEVAELFQRILDSDVPLRCLQSLVAYLLGEDDSHVDLLQGQINEAMEKAGLTWADPDRDDCYRDFFQWLKRSERLIETEEYIDDEEDKEDIEFLIYVLGEMARYRYPRSMRLGTVGRLGARLIEREDKVLDAGSDSASGSGSDWDSGSDSGESCGSAGSN